MMERHACRSPEGFALPGSEDQYPPDLPLEPTHVDLAVRIDLEARSLDVALLLRVRALTGGVRALRLDGVAFEDLEVSVEDGDHAYDGESIALRFRSPFTEGEEREVGLRYRVVDPIAGVYFAAPGSEATFAVTDHETERARYWLASIDHPSARPTFDIRLTVPEALTALANGAQIAREVNDDGTVTVRFAQTEGCPSYLVCFAVGDFARWDGGERNGVPIAAFAPRPYGVSELERTFGPTPDLLAFFERRLGVPYPFAKYFQFAAEGIGGAMENISLVSWDDRFLLDETLETEERHLIDIINVHEMAHSWFGDRVVCRDHAHAWLKEGWATYMESCWLEETYGRDAMAIDLIGHADVYFAETDERYRRPIVARGYSSSFDLYDAHLYPGAALRIHMLRVELGDDVFWSAVQTYLETFAGRVVETDDFRRVLEARSGKSLARFFDQWFYRPSFPDLEVAFRYDSERGRGTFEIVQKQANESTKEGVFVFDLELAFGGHDAMRRETLRVEERRTVASFSMPAAPDLVRVDPEGKLLHRLAFDPGIERSLRQLDVDDARGRIEAGRRLAKSGGRRGVDALRARFEAEREWGVRVKWAEALGKASSSAALDALLSFAETHDDPRSLAAIFRALRTYRDPRIAGIVERRLDGGLPYRAAEAALETLGAQREAAPLERLVAAALEEGFGGFVQSGALRALGATRRAEALETLARALEPGGAPDRVRPAAAQGLGALASSLERGAKERAIEALVAALRDHSPKVRLAAAAALGKARAKEAAQALDALACRLPRQDEVKVRRVLLGLGGDGPDAATKREHDELSERVRRLTGRVEDLEAELRAARER